MGDERAETYLRLLAEAELRRVGEQIRRGETAAWRGVIQFSPVPPRRARWLDLIGDGTRLLRLPLRPDRPATLPSAEATAIPPADRLLTLKAERILATALTAIPDAAELVLTGPSTRVRVRFV